MEQKKRPTGVTILAILALIGGIFSIIGGIAAIGLGAVYGVGLMLLGIITLVVGVVDLVFAVGAWSLKPWAWMLGVIVYGVSLIMAIINGITGGEWGSQAITIVISIIVLYYLNTPGVKQAFGRA